MTMNQARFGLLVVFVFCLLLQLLAFLSVGHKMWPEELQALVLKILAIYSIHLTIILAGIFAQPKGSLVNPHTSVTWAALMLSLLWNALLIWRSFSFAWARQDSVQDLMKYLDGVASASSFLVTGALAFFFTRGTEIVPRAPEDSPPRPDSHTDRSQARNSS